MTTLSFGKYSGKSVYEVWDTDEQYARWCIREVAKPEAVTFSNIAVQEHRLNEAEKALSEDNEDRTITMIERIQEGGLLTEKQGQRFVSIVESAISNGWGEQ